MAVWLRKSRNVHLMHYISLNERIVTKKLLPFISVNHILWLCTTCARVKKNVFLTGAQVFWLPVYWKEVLVFWFLVSVTFVNKKCSAPVYHGFNRRFGLPPGSHCLSSRANPVILPPSCFLHCPLTSVFIVFFLTSTLKIISDFHLFISQTSQFLIPTLLYLNLDCRILFFHMKKLLLPSVKAW